MNIDDTEKHEFVQRCLILQMQLTTMCSSEFSDGVCLSVLIKKIADIIAQQNDPRAIQKQLIDCLEILLRNRIEG